MGAIGIGALAIALVAGGPGNDAAPAAGTDGSASGAAPIGRVSGWTAPDGTSDVRLDHGGRGGMRGGIGNAITITAIDGTKLALKTDNGWTRTIDAAGATVTKDGATVAVSTLKVGDRIVFRETRNDDGTYTITAITVIQPAVAGTVASVSGSTVTVTRRDGSTSKVVLTGSTTYQLAGKAATKDAVVTGARIVARGTLATDGTLTATSVEVAPATFAGTVKEKSASSLTLTTRDGSTVVVKVTSSTTYQVAGVTSPTLADVKVGDVVMAAGTRNADGSLDATVVRSHAAGQFGGPGTASAAPGRRRLRPRRHAGRRARLGIPRRPGRCAGSVHRSLGQRHERLTAASRRPGVAAPHPGVFVSSGAVGARPAATRGRSGGRGRRARRVHLGREASHGRVEGGRLILAHEVAAARDHLEATVDRGREERVAHRAGRGDRPRR